jgi:hypothetical protein
MQLQKPHFNYDEILPKEDEYHEETRWDLIPSNYPRLEFRISTLARLAS